MNVLPPARELVVFVTAAMVLLMIPGPAVIYIVTRSVDQGRKAGIASAAGIATGGLTHVIAATLGFSALLVSSATAYSAVRYVGAGYLVYLGIRKYLEHASSDGDAGHACPVPLRRVYANAILVQVLNPKSAIFFFAFLPQFVNPARGHVALQFLELGMLFSVMGLASDSSWAFAAGTASGWLRRNRRFVASQRYFAGTVYLGLGLATAMTGWRHK
jgi:threonine/homoserine/homoserine lactone efflux protein